MMEISFTFFEQVLKILVIPWPLHLVKTDATFLEKKNSECQLVRAKFYALCQFQSNQGQIQDFMLGGRNSAGGVAWGF